MHRLPVAADALPYLAGLLILTILFYFLWLPLSVVFLLLLLSVLFFFRNPPRKAPDEKKILVSPADGVVMSIEEMDERDFIRGRAVRISIFLSLMNVHINRSPMEGVVRYRAYRPGKYLPAFKSHASEINERSTIGIEGEEIRILVHQITGFVARRIVCRVREGDRLGRGERYGLIKFGSCTELVVPAGAVDIRVKPGDKVKGGISILGVIH